MNTMSQEGKALVYRWDGEGAFRDALGEEQLPPCVPPCWERWRIRIMPCLPGRDRRQIEVGEYVSRITNGKITAELTVDS